MTAFIDKGTWLFFRQGRTSRLMNCSCLKKLRMQRHSMNQAFRNGSRLSEAKLKDVGSKRYHFIGLEPGVPQNRLHHHHEPRRKGLKISGRSGRMTRLDEYIALP